MSDTVILDASALLAVVLKEKGADIVVKALEEGNTCMTTVNLAEVMVKMYEHTFSKEDINAFMDGLSIHVIDVDMELAHIAASYYPKTKSLGLSLADKICFAAAALGNYKALTTDRAWAKANVGVKVQVIR
jgi:PIN domain nuclease of toxin-antitoxin system